VKRRLLNLRDRVRRSSALDVGAVLAVTISVQGLTVVAQFLIAVAVGPEQLGLIRWLESAFAIGLLATSCGMPSVVFREAALCGSAGERFRLFARAAVIASSAAGLVFVVGLGAYGTLKLLSATAAWAMLAAMTGALWPANVARIGIAMIQGGQLSRAMWPRLLTYSGAAIALLSSATWMFGVKGWVTARYVVEFGLATLVVHALAQPHLELAGLAGSRRDLQRLFRLGSSANFAFLARAISDNLPVLLLKSDLSSPSELGWYAFANLTILVPTLFLSVLMQTRLPTLVQSVHDLPEFAKQLSRTQRELLRAGGVGFCVMAGLAFLLHWKVALADYTNAAWPLVILGATLPFRALILTAGSAAVAQGRYAISSILAFTEIAIVMVAALGGRANTATEMASAVLGASALSMLPALALIRFSRKTGP